MRVRLPLPILFCLAALAGCAGGLPTGAAVSAADWRAAYADYSDERRNFPGRAALELRCPEEELQLTKVSHSTSMVEGCGCRAMYVWRGGMAALNSTSGECAARIE